ncbi:MAG: hypothetical protein H6529_11330 [Nocardioides sp.]|nr:hypothetical protein [Nocardioidaceae bacterium]MCB8957056.1 hypothetical protein [Nocardioides sp.]
MRRPAAAVLAALVLTATGCSGGSDEPAPAPSTPTPTPLSELDARGLDVARTSFCAQVAPAAVEDALGGASDSSDEWVNGDRARLADGVTDVAHEFGCRWVAADGTTATGWVFAPPVTPKRAEELRTAAAKASGCRPVAAAPPYGAHSVAVRCEDGTTAFHGLFGDAWLSCSLRIRPAGDADLDRVGRWCATVAQAAGS